MMWLDTFDSARIKVDREPNKMGIGDTSVELHRFAPGVQVVVNRCEEFVVNAEPVVDVAQIATELLLSGG